MLSKGLQQWGQLKYDYHSWELEGQAEILFIFNKCTACNYLEQRHKEPQTTCLYLIL